MNNKTQEDYIREVGQEVIDLLIRKNRDYGDSFSKRYQKHGLLSAFIRMEDKWARLDNLISGAKANVEESIDDTMRDLCGYLVLTLVERKKEREMKGK